MRPEWLLNLLSEQWHFLSNGLVTAHKHEDKTHYAQGLELSQQFKQRDPLGYLSIAFPSFLNLYPEEGPTPHHRRWT